MYLIGTPTLFLKFLSIRAGFLLFTLICVSTALSLDRSLTPTEIEKLQKNIQDDPKNITARRFLISHFSKVNQWSKLKELGVPVQKELPPSDQLLLAQAFIELADANAAIVMLGFYNSQSKPSVTSKTLEAKALSLIAQKETAEDKRKLQAIKIIDTLREATEIDPKKTEPYMLWIETLKLFWKTYAEDALMVYHQLEVAINDYEVYSPQKCVLYSEALLWDQALVSCEKAISKNPNDWQSHLVLSKAQSIKLLPEEAKKTLLKAVEKFPKSSEVHFEMAEFYFGEKNFISAADHYKKSIALNATNAFAFLHLAQCQFQLKNFEDSLLSFQKSCQLTRTLASEFKHATGELRFNISLHNKFKNVMSSCQK